MIRKFAAWLIAAALLTLGACPAQAGPFVVTRFLHPASLVTAPGGTNPDVLPGVVAANTAFNTITPAQHGSAADSAYNMRGFCRFTDVPLVEVGQSGVNGTRHIGVVCAHAAGDSEVAAGIASNIDHVDCRVDGGAWYTITAPTSNPDAGGVTDWNCTVNSQNFSDGLHQMDFRAVPTIGPDIIMEGPLEDANHYATARMDAAMISDGTGSAPGNVLTVVGSIYNVAAIPGVSSLIDGYSLSGTAVSPNTFIDKTHADDVTFSGTGATGTYHVRGASQLAGGAVFTATISGTTMTVTAVAHGTLEKDDNNAQLFGVGVTPGTVITARPTGGLTGTYTISPSQTLSTPTTITQTEPMVAGNERSFYFITDFHCTLRGTGNCATEGKSIVYASKTGNDSWDGLAPTFVSGTRGPKLNPTSASAVIASQDPAATGKGKWGGIVCLVDGGSWTTDVGTGTPPTETLGFLKFQSADQAPCVHPGDVGNAALTFNTSYRTWGGITGVFQRVWYNHMTLNGAPSTTVSALATQLVAQNTITVAPGKLTDGTFSNSLLGASGYACLEAQITITQGGCGTPLVRNTTVAYHNNQAFHNTEVVLNSTESGGGPNYGYASGTATSGSATITGVAVPVGYNISDLFNDSVAGSCFNNFGCMGVAATAGGASCFPNGETFTGTISDGAGGAGNTLTITFVSPGSTIRLGDVITGKNMTAVTVTAFLTGAGGVGTYTVSGAAQSFSDTVHIDTTMIAHDDVNHTITTDQKATCSATGALMYPGVHGDIVQLAVNSYAADVYWANNTGGAVFPGCEQGFFIEQHHVSGIYYGHNHFENLPGCGMTNLFLAGGNDNVISDSNVFAGSTGARLDTDGTNVHPSDAETFVGDTCTSSPGTTMNGTGTRIRRKAAAASACYTSQ